MKHIFTLLIVIASFSGIGQVTRTVLIEHFTNNSNLPSASQNPLFYGNIIDPNVGDVIHVAYHTQGGDIFGESNPVGVAARQTLYGSSNIPFTAMNGRIPDNSNTSGGSWLTYPGAPTGYTQQSINNELMVLSDVSVKVSHSYNSNFSQLNVRCVITNETSSAVNVANQTLLVSIATETLNYSVAPNSNGETYFRNTHRTFLPNENGTALNGSINPGDSLVFTLQEAVSQEWINLSEVKAIAFIQDNPTLEILQAGESTPSNFTSAIDLSLTDATVYPTDFCNSSITPSLTVINNLSGTVDSVEITASINGNAIGSYWFDLPINGAGQENIQLPSITLNDGSNTINYELTDSRGDIETDFSNNSLSIFQVLYIPPHTDNSTYTFETVTVSELPTRGYFRTFNTPNDKTILYVADQSISSSVSNSIGGYGASENALVFDFFSSANNETIEFFLEENGASLPGSTTTLKLDYAYAERNNLGDRFQIMSSLDCGVTWDTIFDESGANLATTGSVSGRFWPKATDWDSLEFNFTSPPLLRFYGSSSRRNALYIDNISLDVVGNVQNVKSSSNIVVYPNPSRSTISVKSSSLIKNISVIDLNGRMIHQSQRNSEIVKLNVEDLDLGIYILYIELEDGSKTQQKIIIQ